MSGRQPPAGTLSIGAVLDHLRGEFPGVSISKIRFLEAEGLVTPERAASGYRRFRMEDVDRLRAVLTAQRDHYLPLRVIRDRLAAGEALVPDEQPDPDWDGPEPAVTSDGMRGGLSTDALAGSPVDPAAGGTPGISGTPGTRGAPTSPAGGSTPAAPGRPRPRTTARLTRPQLAAASGLTEAVLAELEAFGLIRATGGRYGAESQQVAQAAAALSAHGVEARHLRVVRNAADREIALVEQVVAPLLAGRSSEARRRARDQARQVADEVRALHRALVQDALARSLGT